MHDFGTLYDAIGPQAFSQLIENFYRRVPDDDLLGRMYPRENLAEAQRRLLGFLLFRAGGPDQYIQERGHPRLRMRHLPFVIDRAARDRWMSLMEQAMAESDLPEQAVQTLRAFFDESATFLINRQE